MMKMLYIIREDVEVKQIEKTTLEIYHDAISGLEALKPDVRVVLIDLGIIGFSGLDCLKVIRSNPFNHQIKIIVCSRNYNIRLIRKAFTIGADFYISLPLDNEEIKVILNDIIKNMKYIDYNSAFKYVNYQISPLQNDKVEV